MNSEAGFFDTWITGFFDFWPELLDASIDTLYMVFTSTFLSLFFGFFLAVLLIMSHPQGLRPQPKIYRALDVIVNLGRSFPFIILLIAIQPFTRLIVGKTIDSEAAIVPLTVAAIPFAARVLEGSFLEVDRGVVEAARSFGAGTMQIIFRVMLPEALPALILNAAVIAITLLGYAAMAGVVGGGGLGDLAIKYGYNRFKPEVMLYSIVILVIMVQCIQSLGNILYKKLR
jgi:D-methionine transport system permease protein